MGLVRKTQIVMAEEAIEGSAATLTSTDLLSVLADPAPTFRPDNQLLRRNLATGNLTPTQGRPTFQSGTVTFSMELAGPSDGDQTTSPFFAIPLQGCGIEQIAGKVFSGGTMALAPSTSIVPNGSTAAGATWTALVHHRFFDGDTHIFVEGLTGTLGFEATDYSAGSSDADAWENTPGVMGDTFIYKPVSGKVSGIAGTVSVANFAVDDTITGVTSGAKGRVVEALATGAGTLKYELAAGTGNFQAGETINSDLTTAVHTAGGMDDEAQLEMKSYTIEGRFDGVIHKLKGCRGTVTIRCEAGGTVFLDFEFTGQGVAPSDGSLFTEPTAPALPAILKNTTLNVQTDASGTTGTNVVPKWQNFTIALNNTIELPPCPDDPSGYSPATIVSREPSVSLDPEVYLEAVYPWAGLDRSKAHFRIQLQLGDGANDGNSFVIQVPFCQVASFSTGDRGGVNTYDLDIAPAGAEVNNSTITAANQDTQNDKAGTQSNEELFIASY